MKVFVLGFGISGLTASAFLMKNLLKNHDVIVVLPSQFYQWVPSNIWVGVGIMTIYLVRFKLEKVYNRWGIIFKQAKVTAIYLESSIDLGKDFVDISYTSTEKSGETEKIDYDYLVNAMEPKLNVEVTEGLGPSTLVLPARVQRLNMR